MNSYLIIWLILIAIFIIIVMIIAHKKINLAQEIIKESSGNLTLLLRKRCRTTLHLISLLKRYLENDTKLAKELSTLQKNISCHNLSQNKLDEIYKMFKEYNSTIENSLSVYPGLRNNRNISQLQTEIVEIERQLDIANKKYSEDIFLYNKEKSRPTYWFATLKLPSF